MKTATIIRHIRTVEDAVELRKIADAAKKLAKEAEVAAANRIGWHVGQEVRLKKQHQTRKPYGAKGIVEKVNTKNLSIEFEIHGGYGVPKTMLEPIGD